MDNIYKPVIESLIFSSDDPLTTGDILKAIKAIDGEDTEISAADVEEAVTQLNNQYSEQNNSFRILKIANGYLYATTEENAKYVGYLSSERTNRRLSHAALETLSIIAYKQPITKPELEALR